MNDVKTAMPSTASISAQMTTQYDEHRRVEAARRLAARTAPRATRTATAGCAACTQSTTNASTRRQQQDQPDDSAPVEVLLADHLLVDVDRQHVEVAADHLRDAEVV